MGFTGWLIFAVVLFILFQVLKAWSKQHTLKELRDGSNPDGAYVWPELGEFEVDVVGESRHQRELQEIALHSAPGKSLTAVLILEDDNPADKNAVLVTILGRKVGYLARDDAPTFRKRLKKKADWSAVSVCRAVLTGGHELPNGTKASFGVMLDLAPLE
jgi:hypothetical protein